MPLLAAIKVMIKKAKNLIARRETELPAKAWFSTSELAGLPGLPTTPHGVLKRAKRLSWLARPRAGRGGGREFYISNPPKKAQRAALRRHRSRR